MKTAENQRIPEKFPKNNDGKSMGILDTGTLLMWHLSRPMRILALTGASER